MSSAAAASRHLRIQRLACFYCDTRQKSPRKRLLDIHIHITPALHYTFNSCMPGIRHIHEDNTHTMCGAVSITFTFSAWLPLVPKKTKKPHIYWLLSNKNTGRADVSRCDVLFFCQQQPALFYTWSLCQNATRHLSPCLCCRECTCSVSLWLGSLSSLCFTLLETYVLSAGQCPQQRLPITFRQLMRKSWWFYIRGDQCFKVVTCVHICFDPLIQHHVSDGATEAAGNDVWQNKSADNVSNDCEFTKLIAYFSCCSLSCLCDLRLKGNYQRNYEKV